MEENTVFQKNNTSDLLPASNQQQASQVEGVPTVPKQIWQQTPPPNHSGFPFGRIFKILLGVLVVAIIIFFGSSFVSQQFMENKNKKEDVTIAYWGLWETENVMRIVLNDFEKQNPGTKVSYVKQDIKQYRNRVVTRAQNDTGPDVFMFHNTWLSQMSTFLLPLPNDVISKDELQKTFYPVIANDITKNGVIYSVPTGIDTLALFINSEIFQQAGITPPTNWQDFARIARMLTVKDGEGKIKTAGAAMGTFDNITHAPDLISLLVVQNGGDITNMEETKESVVDALDFYTSFARDEGKVWDTSLDPSLLAFSKGNLAMYFGYSWNIFTIKQLNPQLSFQVVSVPHLPGRNMTIASYWVNGISAKSKYQKEALLLMKFLSTKETMQKLFSESSKTRLFGQPYPNSDLADSLKDNAYLYPFVFAANDATSSFFASDTFDDGINAQMNAYLGNAVRAMLNNTSTETAVDTLIQGVAQVLQQYGQ